MKSALVIGGGIGGLSCAIRLAGAGVKVTLLERNQRLGGKLQRVKLGGYTFDRGPSTITMIDAFASVFRNVDRHVEDYVHFYPLEPMARNLFYDGHQVDLSRDVSQMQEQIARYSAYDARNYPLFMAEARKLYAISKKAFLHSLMIGWRDKLQPSLLRSFLQIKPLTNLHALLTRYFQHANTLAMFGRYATYVGSSPYQSPAIFAMMASLEAEEGIYGVYGGTYEIVAAMEKLAIELGVDIQTSTEVRKLAIRNGTVVAAETDKGEFTADVVIANADALTVYSKWIPAEQRPSMSDRAIGKYEPSLSGFVLLAGVQNVYQQLLHHTVFFPEHYPAEFDHLFRSKTKLPDPTIYICYNGIDEAEMAPTGGSNLFVLVNAPSQLSGIEWSADLREEYGNHLLAKLEGKGLTGLRQSLAVRDTFTPQDLQTQFGAHQGGIYGISSNSRRQTFFRPENRAKGIDNLWFVGGTTHPGGGTPIVALSGQLVAERLLSLHHLN